MKCPKPRLAASVAGGVTTLDTMASMIRIKPIGAVVTATKREEVMVLVCCGVVIRCLSGANKSADSGANTAVKSTDPHTRAAVDFS